MTYAARTKVPIDRSKKAIEDLLLRYGADQFIAGWAHAQALVQFRAHGRYVKFLLPIPERKDYRSVASWEQDCRARWRALTLCIKAKLEAVEAGITSFDDEFLAHFILPNGSTVSQFLVPQIEAVYANGKMPALLEALKP